MQWASRAGSPWPARLLALAVALLVSAPVLAPGFVLLRDMVFVPRQDLDPTPSVWAAGCRGPCRWMR